MIPTYLLGWGEHSSTYVSAKSLQLYPTLCDPMGCSPPGPLSMGFSRQEYWSGLPYPYPRNLPDPGIEPASLVYTALQVDSLSLNYGRSPNSTHGGLVAKSCPTLATPWTVAHQAPLSMGFSRQEYWSGLPFPSSGDLPDPGSEARSPALQADGLLTKLWGKP